MQTAPVLHVLPFDLARGAQIYARALRDFLDRASAPHQIVTLFEPMDAVLSADFPLDVPIGWPRRAGFDPRAAVRLHQLVRSRRPRVLVAHGSEPLKYSLLVGAAQAPRIPVVSYRIGVSALEPGGTRARLFAAQLQAADAVAGVSGDVLTESIEKFGVPVGRCTLIPNGRDPDVYMPAVVSPKPGVIFVGHFDSNKRPDLVVDVVETLRATGVPFTAAMVGDGPLLDRLRPRAEAAGIRVLGRRSDVPDLLREATVFLLVSRMEGMPGVFIEAGLCGLATVTTDVPGAQSVVEHGSTGFIVAQDDKQGLVDAIRQLLTDPSRATEMGRAARSRCVDKFSLARGAALWEQLLQEVAP